MGWLSGQGHVLAPSMSAEKLQQRLERLSPGSPDAHTSVGVRGRITPDPGQAQDITVASSALGCCLQIPEGKNMLLGLSPHLLHLFVWFWAIPKSAQGSLLMLPWGLDVVPGI